MEARAGWEATLDDREKRQLRMEYDVDDVIDLDLPAWYLRLTSRITGRWRREVAVVLSALVLRLAVGTALGFGLARHLG